MTWYDRQGQPITMDEAEALMRDIDRRRVALTTVPTKHSPTGQAEVSTVHLVHNLAFDLDRPPLIFETMTFASRDGHRVAGGADQDVVGAWRWSTEAQAAAGHRQVVAWLLGEGPEPEASLW